MINWAKVKHFKSTENWGNPTLISPELIYELDAFRQRVGSRILISCGTQGKHCFNSFHYWKRDPSDDNEMPKGLAVDIVFPDVSAELPELFLEALKMNFMGVGIYPHWKYDDRITGGMHLDVRPTQYRATWIGLGDGLYEQATFENIQKHFRGGSHE